MELPPKPLVLVLLVATDGAKWLPECLEGLRAQRHRPIDILAVDNASSDGSADLLVDAVGPQRVITLPRRTGYGRALAAALKVAEDRGVTPDAYLIVHDDATLSAGSVEAMLETLGHEDVGIVGAKLLEWENPDRLQEVGQTADRFGRIVTRIERGEVDQGQHDGTHDVLFSTSAALLVGREVLERVGLFDLRYVALRDDFDFCWRARLAGYRTVVTTAATARHASASIRGLRSTPIAKRQRYYADRNRIASLIKNYSLLRLAVALPLSVAIALVSVPVFFFTRRRRTAVQVLEALQWNVVQLAPTLRARARVQRARTVRDGRVAAVMRHGSAPMRSQLERALELIAGDVEESDEEDLERPPRTLTERIRAHPTAFVVMLSLGALLLGARTLFLSGQVAGADFAPFPGSAGQLFAEFASGWRGAGAGGAGPATPGLVLLGALQLLCFGSAWLAQRVLLLGLVFATGINAYRFARTLGFGRGARNVAALTYAASPLVLGTFAAGRLADLVLLAAAPPILLRLLRTGVAAPQGGAREQMSGIAIVAIAAALAPWTLVFTLGVGLLLSLLSPGHRGAVARRSVVMAGGAFVLLLPWSVELLRGGSPLAWGGTTGVASMTDLVALSPGGVRPLARGASFGIALAALAGIVLAPSERRRAAPVFGGLALAGLLAAWAVGRGATWIAPRPALPLVVAALAFAALAALAFDWLGPRLSSRQFGAAHVALAIVGLLLVAQFAGGLTFLARGSFVGLVESGSLAPSFFVDEARRIGHFRIAWIGGRARTPAVDLTGAEGRTMRSYLSRHSGGGEEAFVRSVAAIAGGGTDTGGRLLATLGVRYVIVRPEAEPVLADAVARQTDLAFVQRFREALVYRNQVPMPVAASTSGRGWVAASGRALDSLAGTHGGPRAGPGFARDGTVYRGRAAKGSSVVLLGENYSPLWRVRRPEGAGKAERSFGWANRFRVPGKGARTVEIAFAGQTRHRLALALQVLILLFFVGRWSRLVVREGGDE